MTSHVPILTLTRTKQNSAVVAVPIRSKAAVESTVVHVLFIDIVGYSKLSMEAQERASSELTECVRGIPSYVNARLEGNITCLDTGDGMVLVFEGDPTAAALAALQIANCRGDHPECAIRMGLHSGPATLITDINGHQNFKGVGINIAQRVMDLANGGHIMLTEHYASMLRNYEGWGSRIQSRGTQSIKHGVKLRVCELKHEFAHRLPISEKLHQPLKPVHPALRWLGILSIIALAATSAWTIATQEPNHKPQFSDTFSDSTSVAKSARAPAMREESEKQKAFPLASRPTTSAPPPFLPVD